MDADKIQIISELRDLIESTAPKHAKESGKPVVGYFCSYLPQELLWAAGLYPLRLRGVGVEGSSTGDAYLSNLTCSFVRQVVSAILDGAQDYLAGQISLNTCDHVRRGNDVIIAKGGLKFNGYLAVPHGRREDMFKVYVEDIERLKSEIEDHFSVKITAKDLNRSIGEVNAVRDRLAKLDALRASDEPRLSGAEMHTAAIAARTLPPEKFVELADSLIAAVENSEPIGGIRARVILIGGELDDPRWIKIVESQGAHVAGDLLCYGLRGMGLPVETGDSPIEALAKAYLEQIPCARMMGEFPRRYDATMELYRDRNAAGIIFQRIKFCQIWGNEVHNLMHRFADQPTPFIALEREYGGVSTGQIKTRIQAFLEKIGA